MKFIVNVINQSKQKEEIEIEAENRKSVISTLKKQGFLILEINEKPYANKISVHEEEPETEEKVEKEEEPETEEKIEKEEEPETEEKIEKEEEPETEEKVEKEEENEEEETEENTVNWNYKDNKTISKKLSIIIFLLIVIFSLLATNFYPPQNTQFEYKLISPHDIVFEVEMNRMGKEGWEIVSARRATSKYSDAVYEVILKRAVPNN